MRDRQRASRVSLGTAIAFEHRKFFDPDPGWRLVGEDRADFDSVQVAGDPFLRGGRFPDGGLASMQVTLAVAETISDLGGAEPLQ